MKEKIETIPVNEAFDAGDECPFCQMERMTEQRTIRYVLGPGASYMEPDVRGVTDRRGFCRGHYKKMYDYGNALGSALMMQTHYAGLLEEFRREAEQFEMPAKKPLFGRKKTAEPEQTGMAAWAKERMGSCYICDRVSENMERYYATFFWLLREPEFRAKVERSKGFCMCHFAQLMEHARQELSNDQREWFYRTVFPLMEENLERMKGDIDWFVAKFDYRNAGADWKNSRDAVSRGMQKLQGGYPADRPFQMDPK